jgi:hypothetical protein
MRVALPFNNSHPHWSVIVADQTPLPNGQLARDTIRIQTGHCDHFDVRIVP